MTSLYWALVCWWPSSLTAIGLAKKSVNVNRLYSDSGSAVVTAKYSSSTPYITSHIYPLMPESYDHTNNMIQIMLIGRADLHI